MKKTVIALSALLAFTGAVAAPAWTDWETFKSVSMESGRVIDPSDSRLIPTSEGESYALFFALVAGDTAAFESILAWTENNLAAGD